MQAHTAVDLGREALTSCLVIGGPILLILVVVGLVMAVFQTVTNVHDYSIAFVPKLVAVVLAVAICLPWMMGKLVDYSRASFSQVPSATSRSQR
jgi:flagellar biosynthetic protein FliQ